MQFGRLKWTREALPAKNIRADPAFMPRIEPAARAHPMRLSIGARIFRDVQASHPPARQLLAAADAITHEGYGLARL